jgi:hypothetical protein
VTTSFNTFDKTGKHSQEEMTQITSIYSHIYNLSDWNAVFAAAVVA